MLKKLLITFVILIVALLVVVINLPASLLTNAVDYGMQRKILSPKFSQITFSELTGTLWQGQGDVEWVVDDVPLNLGLVSWQLDALSLFSLQLSATILAQGDEHQLAGQVIAFPNGEVHINSAEGFFPISELEPWVPMLVNGQVYFTIFEWQFTQKYLNTLEGVLNFENVDWLGGDYPLLLGDYVAEVSVNQGDVNIQMADLDALLGMGGSIIVDPNGRYKFEAKLTPRAGLAPEIGETIAFFGKKLTDGTVTINQRGRL